MTVKELTTILSRYSKDTEIVLYQPGTGAFDDYYDNEIYIEFNGKQLVLVNMKDQKYGNTI